MLIEKIIDQRRDASSYQESSGVFLFILFFILLFTCYFNSFHCDWHLDDIQNILLNPPLHLTDLSNGSLKQTFFAYPGQPEKLLRPVTNFSFALNWFFGQDNVLGYHIINFTIHFLATLFLYQTCLLLLGTPRFGKQYQDNKFFIAALAAVLWSINPIQTQAVTYIVQRAAALSALFSIIGIWFYLKARLSASRRLHIFFYLGIVISFLLAIGSKENAVLFPASLLLIEFLFFQKNIRFNTQTVLFLLTAIGLVLALTFMLGEKNFFVNILNSYQDRSFSLWQRLLTQPRIIIFYISLLLYPSPLRLSIEHDVQISTSLISPPTTLAAILFLALLAASSLLLYKRHPLFSFAILFFLLNHLVESTIIALELIFEHRNYLPSLFFFLPIAALISSIIKKYRYNNRTIYWIVCTGTASLIVLLSLATILRNMAWQTDTALWADALTKAPQSSRPYINLGYNLQYEGNLQQAFDLYQRSFNKYSATPWKDKVRANNGMGNILMRIGRYEQAALLFDKASGSAQNKSLSMYTDALILRSKALWLDGQQKQAFNLLEKERAESGKHMQFYAEMLLAFGKNKEALDCLRRILSESNFQSTEYKMALLDLALLHDHIGHREKTEFYLRLARKLNAPKVPTLLSLVEHSIRAGDPLQTEQAFAELLEQVAWTELLSILDSLPPDYPALPISPDRIRQYAADWLASKNSLQ